MILKTGKRRFLCQKLKCRNPSHQGLRIAETCVKGRSWFLGYVFSYNARYVKQREVKKPSFPDFGSFSVPPAFRPPKPRFAGFAAIYLFFIILYFVFFIIIWFFIIWFFGLHSLYNLFFRHSLFASHYLYLLLRSFQSFYFSVYDHLVMTDQIVGCIPVGIFVDIF